MSLLGFPCTLDHRYLRMKLTDHRLEAGGFGSRLKARLLILIVDFELALLFLYLLSSYIFHYHLVSHIS